MTSPELPPQGRDSRDALVSLHSEIGKAVVGQEGALVLVPTGQEAPAEKAS